MKKLVLCLACGLTLCSCTIGNTYVELREGKITKENVEKTADTNVDPEKVDYFTFKVNGKINNEKVKFSYNSKDNTENSEYSAAVEQIINHLNFKQTLKLENENEKYLHFWFPFICNFFICKFDNCKCYYDAAGNLFKINYLSENLNFNVFVFKTRYYQTIPIYIYRN